MSTLLTTDLEKQNRGRSPLASWVFIVCQLKFKGVLSWFQIGAENHAARIIQTATETVEKIVAGGSATIDSGFEDTSVWSGEEKRPDRSPGELDCHCAAGLVPAEELVGGIL